MTQRIDVVTTDDAPACPRCGCEALLWARIPHGWTNTAGERVESYSGGVLCPACDAQTPHAAALITWFHVNGQADDEDTEFVQLLVAWATSVLMTELNEQALEDEIEQWRRGAL
ncbi:DUF6300 family protein [Nonomuraea sp. NPDC050153]|uniref:DUF6300 family protein n=1 Tax=Nonomuraea sp. NPDC050153 TaxID=3364359 RepID=UPI00379ADE8B